MDEFDTLIADCKKYLASYESSKSPKDLSEAELLRGKAGLFARTHGRDRNKMEIVAKLQEEINRLKLFDGGTAGRSQPLMDDTQVMQEGLALGIEAQAYGASVTDNLRRQREVLENSSTHAKRLGTDLDDSATIAAKIKSQQESCVVQ